MNGFAISRGLVVVLAALVAGCMSSGPLHSSIGVYPDEPRAIDIPGSSKQYMTSRSFPYSFDDVFQATADAAFRRGLVIEQKDARKGIITGKGYWQMICGAGPCKMNITYAAYVKEVDDRPTTKLTFVLDRYSWIGWSGEESVANDFLIEVQKILATY